MNECLEKDYETIKTPLGDVINKWEKKMSSILEEYNEIRKICLRKEINRLENLAKTSGCAEQNDYSKYGLADLKERLIKLNNPTLYKNDN